MRTQLGEFEAAAAAGLELQRGANLLEAVLESNGSVQSDERMVLEAIFDEDISLGLYGDETRFSLTLTSEGGAGGGGGGAGGGGNGVASPIVLHLRTPPEYPSHVAPTIDSLEGLEEAEADYVRLALLKLFYERRGPLGEADGASPEDSEVAMGVVTMWTEWLKDEWLAKP